MAGAREPLLLGSSPSDGRRAAKTQNQKNARRCTFNLFTQDRQLLPKPAAFSRLLSSQAVHPPGCGRAGDLPLRLRPQRCPRALQGVFDSQA